MTAWPSISTLAEDTKWGEKKVRKVKKQLIEKGVIEVKERVSEYGNRSSDIYTCKTEKIGVFMTLKPNENAPTQNGQGGTTQIDQGPPTQNGKGKYINNRSILTSEASKDAPDFDESYITPKDKFADTRLKPIDLQYWGELSIKEILGVPVPANTYGKQWESIYYKLIKWGKADGKSIVTLAYGIGRLCTALKHMSDYHREKFTVKFFERNFDEILPEAMNNKKKKKQSGNIHAQVTGGAVYESIKNYNPRG